MNNLVLRIVVPSLIQIGFVPVVLAGTPVPTQTLSEERSTDIVSADFDGDGDIDLVSSSDYGRSQLWLNDGTGLFSDSGLEFGNDFTDRIRVVDIDSDSDPDLLLGGEDGSSLKYSKASIMVNQGGNFSLATSYSLNNDQFGDWAAGDFNNDNNADLVLLRYDEGPSESTLEVWYGPISGATGGEPDEIVPINGIKCISLGVANLSGDASDEIVVGCDPIGGLNDSTEGGIKVWSHDGAKLTGGDFMKSRWVVSDLAFADIDADGDLDIVGVHDSTSSISSEPDTTVWTNNNDGTVSGTTVEIEGRRLDVADMNGDGNPDLVVANGDNLTQYDGDGSGAFTNPTELSVCGAYALAITVDDFNGDGKVDVAFASGQFSDRNYHDLVLMQDATARDCSTLTSATTSSGGDSGGTGGDNGSDDGSDTSSGGGGSLPPWFWGLMPLLIWMARRRNSP